MENDWVFYFQIGLPIPGLGHLMFDRQMPTPHLGRAQGTGWDTVGVDEVHQDHKTLRAVHCVPADWGNGTTRFTKLVYGISIVNQLPWDISHNWYPIHHNWLWFTGGMGAVTKTFDGWFMGYQLLKTGSSADSTSKKWFQTTGQYAQISMIPLIQPLLLILDLLFRAPTACHSSHHFHGCKSLGILPFSPHKGGVPGRSLRSLCLFTSVG
jgi:hypothetical protein